MKDSNRAEETLQKEDRGDKFIFSIRYPWRTLLAAKLLLFYALLLLSPGLVDSLKIPAVVFNAQYFIAAFGGFLILAWLDFKHFSRQQQKVKASLQQLWNSKRQLQQRAQTSASHTDKLKLFISDKLLEYMEYDEKYLHFKSIAAEVRHNGVISFDKVQSALTYAASHSLPDEQGNNALLYQQALVGMRYLWDLLDLSTTDNMALHIGANVSRCEELLFQAELQGTSLNELPMLPTFDPQRALVDTLTLHLGVTLCDEQGNPEPAFLYDSQALAKQPLPLLLTDSEGLYRIELHACDDLLGNANHIVLLLENLLRNAQFFATKRQYKSRFAPIAIRLWEAQQCLCVSVYNRGPHISDEAREQIFQLGFSTRRAREHNGKGLGLYFAQQIVQGFDGDIGFDNIHNHHERYHLRLELAGGEVQNLNLDVELNSAGEPLVRLADSNEEAAKQWQLSPGKRLHSIEISSTSQPQVARLTMEEGTSQWFDPHNPAQPQWLISLSGRKADLLSFMPLDIRGVQFSVRLPTLNGRLDGVGAAGLEPDVDELGAGLRSPDDF
ncbi:MAG: histidine kinase [Thalassobium sp.]|nr:MAG: histidine kinase [Thalassobium sp.]